MRHLTVLLLLSALGALTGCPPAYPNCKSDENCTEKNEVCVQGQCRECATDQNCKPGFVCQANRCEPKPECGPGLSPCGVGKKCSAGKCAVDPTYKPEGSCSANEDCPSGQECKAGRCAAVEVKAGPACTFEPVRFDFNDFNVAGPTQAVLTQYAECIKKGALRFTLEGHADERGTEEYNMVLSQKRAASVRKYLVDLGVTPGALDTVGYGENKPALNESSEAGWSANRRVEFKKK
jgi:peptidoglycan-associated lipoprotein